MLAPHAAPLHVYLYTVEEIVQQACLSCMLRLLCVCRYIEDIVQQQVDAGIPSTSVVVGGFSQGGAIALLSLRSKVGAALCAVLCCSGLCAGPRCALECAALRWGGLPTLLASQPAARCAVHSGSRGVAGAPMAHPPAVP